MGVDLNLVPFKPKESEPLDNAELVEHIEGLLAGVKSGKITGVALAYVEPDGSASTWWGTAKGGTHAGHVNDLASGITRLGWRYQNEAYNETPGNLAPPKS